MIFDMCTRLSMEEILLFLGYSEKDITYILDNITVAGK